MTRGENNELHWFWRFFVLFNFIFLNRDFGCIKTRIYNLFCLLVFNSTFSSRSTLLLLIWVCCRKLRELSLSLKSYVLSAAILGWQTKWPPFVSRNRVAIITPIYRYTLLGQGFWRGGGRCKPASRSVPVKIFTFFFCFTIPVPTVSDLLVCGNLSRAISWPCFVSILFCSILSIVLTEWDYFASNFWVYWGGKSFSWDGLRYNHNH